MIEGGIYFDSLICSILSRPITSQPLTYTKQATRLRGKIFRQSIIPFIGQDWDPCEREAAMQLRRGRIG